MARFTRLPQYKKEDKVIYGDGIVEGIVQLAVSELEFVELATSKITKKTSNNAIRATFDKEGVHVEVDVCIQHNQSVSDVAFQIQEVVRHSVESMTEYHIASVNVFVKDVLF